VHGIPLSAKKRRDLLLRATFRFELDRPRRSGGALEIPVVVENVGAGHKVPAGFSQEREIWVHLTVRDASGGTVYEVGRVSRGDEDLRDKVFERVNVSDAVTDGKGRPLGMFGADVRDGPDLPLWDPPPALGGSRFRAAASSTSRTASSAASAASARSRPTDRAGRCPDRRGSARTASTTATTTSTPASADRTSRASAPSSRPTSPSARSTRGAACSRGRTRSSTPARCPPGVPITYTYELGAGGRPGPFRVEARLLFRAFPPFLVRGFIDYEREQPARASGRAGRS
jgi:hypothetical protein